MIDLSAFDLEADAERGTTVPLHNPRTGQPLTADDGSVVEITVQGADSKAYRQAQRDVQREVSMRSDVQGPMGVAEVDRYACEILANVTTGWRNIVVDGSVWECNREAAQALYGRFGWIREQVDAVVTNRTKFGPAEPLQPAA